MCRTVERDGVKVKIMLFCAICGLSSEGIWCQECYVCGRLTCTRCHKDETYSGDPWELHWYCKRCWETSAPYRKRIDAENEGKKLHDKAAEAIRDEWRDACKK
jgi:hypothetical protein